MPAVSALSRLIAFSARKIGLAGEDLWEPTELMKAAERDDAPAVQAILARAPEEAQKRQQNGWTALMWAAYGGSVDCARLLLPLSDPQAVSDESHASALILAARKGHREIVDLLLPVSDPTAADKSGYDAFLSAIAHEQWACARSLAASADFSRRDFRGRTPLMIAAQSPSPEGVELTLARSDLAAVDRDGRTALAIAAREGSLASAQALFEAAPPSPQQALAIVADAIEQGREQSADWLAARLGEDARAQALAAYGPERLPRAHAAHAGSLVATGAAPHSAAAAPEFFLEMAGSPNGHFRSALAPEIAARLQALQGRFGDAKRRASTIVSVLGVAHRAALMSQDPSRDQWVKAAGLMFWTALLRDNGGGPAPAALFCPNEKSELMGRLAAAGIQKSQAVEFFSNLEKDAARLELSRKASDRLRLKSPRPIAEPVSETLRRAAPRG